MHPLFAVFAPPFAPYSSIYVKKGEKVGYFWKKVAEIFGGLEKSPYLCTRFREIHCSGALKKEFFERFT